MPNKDNPDEGPPSPKDWVEATPALLSDMAESVIALPAAERRASFAESTTSSNTTATRSSWPSLLRAFTRNRLQTSTEPDPIDEDEPVPWSSGKVYSVGDVVWIGDQPWRCETEHTAEVKPSSADTKWTRLEYKTYTAKHYRFSEHARQESMDVPAVASTSGAAALLAVTEADAAQVTPVPEPVDEHKHDVAVVGGDASKVDVTAETATMTKDVTFHAVEAATALLSGGASAANFKFSGEGGAAAAVLATEVAEAEAATAGQAEALVESVSDTNIKTVESHDLDAGDATAAAVVLEDTATSGLAAQVISTAGGTAEQLEAHPPTYASVMASHAINEYDVPEIQERGEVVPGESGITHGVDTGSSNIITASETTEVITRGIEAVAAEAATTQATALSSSTSGSLDGHAVVIEHDADTSGELVPATMAHTTHTTTANLASSADADADTEGDWQVFHRRRSSWRKSQAPVLAAAESTSNEARLAFELDEGVVVRAVVGDDEPIATDKDADDKLAIPTIVADDDSDDDEPSPTSTDIAPRVEGTAYTANTVVSHNDKHYRALVDTSDAPHSDTWAEVDGRARRPRRPGHHGSGHGKQHGQGHKRSVSRSRRRRRRAARTALGSVGTLSSDDEESDAESDAESDEDLGEGSGAAMPAEASTLRAVELGAATVEVAVAMTEVAEAAVTERGTEAATRDFTDSATAAAESTTRALETTLASGAASLQAVQVSDATEALASVSTATQWAINTSYAASAIVTFAGASWLCLKEHVALEPPSAGEYWYMLNIDSLLHLDLSALSLHWWSRSERFVGGTLVVYAGLVYRCLRENVGEVPLPGAYWALYEETNTGDEVASEHETGRAVAEVSTATTNENTTEEVASNASASDSTAHATEAAPTPSRDITRTPDLRTVAAPVSPTSSTRSISTVSWAAGTTYAIDQVIYYQHEWWRCVKAHEAVDPPTQGELWTRDVSASNNGTIVQESVDANITAIGAVEAEEPREVPSTATSVATSITAAESIMTDTETVVEHAITDVDTDIISSAMVAALPTALLEIEYEAPSASREPTADDITAFRRLVSAVHQVLPGVSRGDIASNYGVSDTLLAAVVAEEAREAEAAAAAARSLTREVESTAETSSSADASSSASVVTATFDSSEPLPAIDDTAQTITAADDASESTTSTVEAIEPAAPVSRAQSTVAIHNAEQAAEALQVTSGERELEAIRHTSQAASWDSASTVPATDVATATSVLDTAARAISVADETVESDTVIGESTTSTMRELETATEVSLAAVEAPIPVVAIPSDLSVGEAAEASFVTAVGEAASSTIEHSATAIKQTAQSTAGTSESRSVHIPEDVARGFSTVVSSADEVTSVSDARGLKLAVEASDAAQDEAPFSSASAAAAITILGVGLLAGPSISATERSPAAIEETAQSVVVVDTVTKSAAAVDETTASIAVVDKATESPAIHLEAAAAESAVTVSEDAVLEVTDHGPTDSIALSTSSPSHIAVETRSVETAKEELTTETHEPTGTRELKVETRHSEQTLATDNSPTSTEPLPSITEEEESFISAALGPNLVSMAGVSAAAQSDETTEWLASNFYIVGATVTFNGHKWQCIKDSVNVAPANGEFWALVETSRQDASHEMTRAISSTAGEGEIDFAKVTTAFKDWYRDSSESRFNAGPSRGNVGTLAQITASAAEVVVAASEWSGFQIYAANTVVAFEGSYWRSLERSVAGMTPAEGDIWAKIDVKVHPITTLEQHAEWESNVQYLAGTVVWFNGEALSANQTHISSLEFLSDDWMWEDAVEVVVVTKSVRTMSRRTSIAGDSPIRPEFSRTETPFATYSPPPSGGRFVPGTYPSPPRPFSALERLSPVRDEHRTPRRMRASPPDSPVLSPTRGSVSPPPLERLPSQSSERDLPGHFPLSSRPMPAYPSPDSSRPRDFASPRAPRGSGTIPLYQPPAADPFASPPRLGAAFEEVDSGREVSPKATLPHEELKIAGGPGTYPVHSESRDELKVAGGTGSYPRPTSVCMPGHFAAPPTQSTVFSAPGVSDVVAAGGTASVVIKDSQGTSATASSSIEHKGSNVAAHSGNVSSTLAATATSSEVKSTSSTFASRSTAIPSVGSASETYARVTKLEDKAAWSINTLYAVNTVVWFGGAPWKCIAAHKAVEVPSPGVHWDKVNVGFFKPPPCPPNCKIDHTHRAPSPAVSVKSLSEVTTTGASTETTATATVGIQKSTATATRSQTPGSRLSSLQARALSATADDFEVVYEVVTKVDDNAQWIYGRSYLEDSVVWHEGVAWKCAFQHTSVEPPNPLNTRWALYSDVATDPSTPTLAPNNNLPAPPSLHALRMALQQAQTEAMYENDAATAVAAIRESAARRFEGDLDFNDAAFPATRRYLPPPGPPPPHLTVNAAGGMETLTEQTSAAATTSQNYASVALTRSRSFDESATKFTNAARSVSDSVRQVQAPPSVYGSIFSFPSRDTIIEGATTSQHVASAETAATGFSASTETVSTVRERVATIKEHVAWTINVEYASETVVWYNGVAWSCIKAHTSVVPPSEGEFWSIHREYIGAEEEAKIKSLSRTDVAAGSGRVEVKKRSEQGTSRDVRNETAAAGAAVTKKDLSTDMAAETAFGVFPAVGTSDTVTPTASVVDLIPQATPLKFSTTKPRRPDPFGGYGPGLPAQKAPTERVDWKTDTSYEVGNVVVSNKLAWVCIQPHQSVKAPPNDQWMLWVRPQLEQPEPIVYEPVSQHGDHIDWKEGAHYLTDTIVWYRGQAWYCMTTHESSEVPEEGELWDHPRFVAEPILIARLMTAEDKSDWVAGVQYPIKTVVWHDGQAWLCLKGHKSAEAPSIGDLWTLWIAPDERKEAKTTPRSRRSTAHSIDSRSSRRWFSEQQSPESPFFSPRPTGHYPYSPAPPSLRGLDDSYDHTYDDDAPNDFAGAHSSPFPVYPENVDYAALTTIDEHAQFTNITGYLHNTVVWQDGIAWKCLESHIAREEPRESRFWTRVGPGHTHEPQLPSLYGVTLPGFHGHQDGRDVHVIHVYHHFIPAPTAGFNVPGTHTPSTVIAWEAVTTVESETQWQVNASYQVESVVWYLGEAWKCVAAHTSTAPPYTGAYWVKVDVKGKGKGCGCGVHHGERE